VLHCNFGVNFRHILSAVLCPARCMNRPACMSGRTEAKDATKRDHRQGQQRRLRSGASLVRYAIDPPDAYGNPIPFAGYFYDNETGLYHVRHRMYSPILQRWPQRNPLQ